MTIDDVKQARHGDRVVVRRSWRDNPTYEPTMELGIERATVLHTWLDSAGMVILYSDGRRQVINEDRLACVEFERRVKAPDGHWLPEHLYGDNV